MIANVKEINNDNNNNNNNNNNARINAACLLLALSIFIPASFPIVFKLMQILNHLR